MVHTVEAQPGVIIGSCIAEAKDYSCPISVINTNDTEIDFQTPSINIEPIEEKMEEEIFIVKTFEIEEVPISREKKVKNLLRIEHLNTEEKRTIY